MINKFAGLPTQIRSLEKRLKEMDASKISPAKIKEITDTINNLKALLKEKTEKKEQRKKDKEQKAQEVTKEAITVPSATEVGTATTTTTTPATPSTNPATPSTTTPTPDDQKIFCPLCGGITFPDQASYQQHMQFTHASDVMPTTPGQKEDKLVASVEPVAKEETGPQFKLDDEVKPIRGSESKGKVMRWDGKPNDLVYVMWESGPLKDRDTFGGYYPNDLQAVAQESVETVAAPVVEEPVCQKCISMQDKVGDLRSNAEAILKDLKEEREAHYAQGNHSWVARLDQKIIDLQNSINEKFPNDKEAIGQQKYPAGKCSDCGYWTPGVLSHCTNCGKDNPVKSSQPSPYKRPLNWHERQRPPIDRERWGAKEEVVDKEAVVGGPRFIRQINKATSGHGYDATEYDLGNGQFKQNVPLKINETKVRMTDPTSTQYEIKYDGMDWKMVAQPEFEQWLNDWKATNKINTTAGAENAEELTIMDHTPPRANTTMDEGGKDTHDEFQDEWAMPVTSAQKIAVFNKEFTAKPINGSNKLFGGYDISQDGKKLFNIKSKDGQPMNKKQLEFCAQIELTRGMKQAKLVEKIAFLEAGSKVYIVAQDKANRRVKFASLDHGVRGWASASKFAFLVKESDLRKHKDHIDNTYGSNGKEMLCDCPNGSGNMTWLPMGELLPIQQPPATPESLNDIEASRPTWRTCSTCGKDFCTSVYKDYCSEECHSKAGSPKEATKKCLNCGTSHLPLERGLCSACRKNKKAAKEKGFAQVVRPKQGHHYQCAECTKSFKSHDEFKKHDKTHKTADLNFPENYFKYALAKERADQFGLIDVEDSDLTQAGLAAKKQEMTEGHDIEAGQKFECGWCGKQKDTDGGVTTVDGQWHDPKCGAAALKWKREHSKKTAAVDPLLEEFQAKYPEYNGWTFDYMYPGYYRFYKDGFSDVFFTPDNTNKGEVDIQITNQEGENTGGDVVSYKTPLTADALFAIVKPYLDKEGSNKIALEQALPKAILPQRGDVNPTQAPTIDPMKGPSDEDVQQMAWDMYKSNWNALSSEEMDEVYKALGVTASQKKALHVEPHDYENENDADDENETEIEPGDLVDFGAYGQLYVVSLNGRSSRVTDLQEERFNPNAPGWYFTVTGDEQVLEKGSSVKDYTDIMPIESSLSKKATVTHREDGWHVLSEKGKNLGGPYKTKEEAVKRLRQVEYFKHHGSLKPFSKKEAEVLSDPYQSLTTHITEMKGRMDQVQQQLQNAPAVKTAEEDGSKMDLPALFEDVTHGIALLEEQLGGDESAEHNMIEELENKLWKLEEECGITPKLSDHEKAEPEHKEVVEKADEMEKEAGYYIPKTMKEFDAVVRNCSNCDDALAGDYCPAHTRMFERMSPDAPMTTEAARPDPDDLENPDNPDHQEEHDLMDSFVELSNGSFALVQSHNDGGMIEVDILGKTPNGYKYVTNSPIPVPVSAVKRELDWDEIQALKIEHEPWPPQEASADKKADQVTDETIITNDPNAVLPDPSITPPVIQNVQPTDDDNLNVPVAAPTSPTPPGTKWVFDTQFNKYVIMPDASQPGKQI